MNTRSGSVLQKANFILLILIAGALGYLIARDRWPRPVPSQTASPEIAGLPDELPNTAATTSPSHAPLRPRNITPAGSNIDTGTLRFGNNNQEATRVSSVQDGPRVNAALTARERTEAAVPVAITPAAAGNMDRRVAGRVVLRGTPPPEKATTLDAVCGRLHPAPMFTRHYMVGEDGGLANVLVYVKSAPKDASPQMRSPIIDNINCEFQPYVLGVRAGQPLTLRNSDPVLHNMHMTTRPGGGNREVNLALPVRGTSTFKTFTHPEVFIRVKCDVHPWMFAYIGVVEHRWFAVTDADGNFALPPGLPAGDYTIAAVHPKAGERTERIEVSDRNDPIVNVVFEVPDRAGTP